MSIQPYVMETLYRQGSIDYVPYDVLTPIGPIGQSVTQGQMTVAQGQNSYGQTQNMAQLQIQELQRMSQGPITLYPKTQISVNNQVKTNNYGDSFSYSLSPLGEMSGSVVEEIRSIKTQPMTVNNNQESIRASIMSKEDSKGTNNPLYDNKLWLKSLISISAIGLTLFALFKGGKAVTSSGFWSKLNPKNWFK